MTPKGKAQDLVEKMMLYSYDKIENEIYPKYIVDNKIKKELAKQCALIAVDEIIKQEAERCLAYKETDKFIDYWQEVKQEIELL